MCQFISSGSLESVYLIIYFNGTNFELWKLKVEDILVDCDMWVVVSKKKPSGMEQEDTVLIDQKEKTLVRLCLADSILLNINDEKLHILYGRSLEIFIGKNPW